MKLPLPLHSNLWTLLLIFYSTHNGGRYMTTYTSTHINVSTYQKLDRSYFAHSSQYPFCVCMVSHSSPAIAAKLSKLKIWLISLLLAYNSSGSGCLQSRGKKKPLFLSAFSDQPLPAFSAASSTFPWYTHTKFVAIQWTWHTKFLPFS